MRLLLLHEIYWAPALFLKGLFLGEVDIWVDAAQGKWAVRKSPRSATRFFELISFASLLLFP